MTIAAKPNLLAPDDDPYLWLEEIEGKRALTWIDAQNRRTLQQFGGAGYAKDRDTLTAILDRPDRLPFIARRGAFVYNFWLDHDHPRGVWRRTTLGQFATDDPQWDILLDLDALAAKETEDWIWHGAVTLPPRHDRAILYLSRGGSDAVVLREFDLATKGFLPGGFELAEAKTQVDWIDGDTLLVSSAFGDGMATRAGYARTVRLWRRGQAIADARVVFEVPEDRMAAGGGVDRTLHEQNIWYIDRTDFFNTALWRGDRDGPKIKIDIPSDCWIQNHGDWAALKPRSAWTVGGRTYAPDTVLGISLPRLLAGDRDFTVLFSSGERRSLQYFFWAQERLILSILDELQPVFETFQPADGWRQSKLQGAPESGVVDVGRLDMEENESNGDLIVTAQDPITPPTLSLLQQGKAPTILKQSSPAFDAQGLIVTHHQAISIDGERIPYTQIGPKDETGDAPVHMTGYGGFQIASKPYYNASIGKLWLERGGTSVIANIRGGGEFGTRWHEAGMRAGKRLSHDDFAAVAADLVRRGVTRPGRIAAEGGSNGGILISNMLVRYPERFGALFCTIPLIDMRRYTKLLAGASWIAEYGDPDKPEDWAFLQTYSAYHLAQAGKAYPPILIATTRKDDRVHPGHARKMAAKLQDLGYDAYFYEPAAGGHGYGKDNKERAAFAALGLTFLAEKIGWRHSAV